MSGFEEDGRKREKALSLPGGKRKRSKGNFAAGQSGVCVGGERKRRRRRRRRMGPYKKRGHGNE